MKLMNDVLHDNSPWILGLLTVIAVVVAFIYGGPTWIVIGLFIAMAVAVYALWRTAEKRGRALVENPKGSGAQERTSESNLDLTPAVDQTSEPITSNDKSEGYPSPDGPSGGKSASLDKTQAVSESKGVNPTDPKEEHQADPLSLAMAASFEHDLPATRKHLAEWDAIDKPEGQKQRLEHAVLREQLLATAGSGEALIRLRNLADEHPNDYQSVNALAIVLSRTGETRSAVQELESRRNAVEGSDSVSLAILEAQLRRRLDEFDAAIKIADWVISLPSATDRQEILAYVERGYALEEAGRRLEAFGAFERALELDPTSEGIRFHLAYEYSQDGFVDLCISHYEQLAATGSSKSGRMQVALNNVGVALNQLGLPQHAVVQFTKATDQGQALAAANLAHMLLDRGFVDQARTFVDKAIAIDPNNDRAAEAITRITGDYRREDDRLKKRRLTGERFRNVFKLIGQGPTEVPRAGAYTIDDGTQLSLEPDGNTISGKLSNGDKVSFTPDGPILAVEVRKGALGLAKYSGQGAFRGRDLRFYVVSYPTAADTSVYIGTLNQVSQPGC